MPRHGAGRGPVAKKRRKSSSKVPPLTRRERGLLGRLKSYEDAEAARHEVIQRMRDAVFMPEELKRAKLLHSARVKEILSERRSRVERRAANPSAYKWAPKQNNEYAIAAGKLARSGTLPAPTEVRVFDDGSYEYVWAFQGPHGLEAVNDMLIHARDSFPADAAGYISQGTGYGRDAQWGGTAFTPVHEGDIEGQKTLWWQLQTFKLSTTDTLKHLREHFGHKQENGRFPTQWVELKIISSEGMRYENVIENGSAGDARELDERAEQAPDSKKPQRKRNRSGPSGKRGKSRQSAGKGVKGKPRSKRGSKKLPRG